MTVFEDSKRTNSIVSAAAAPRLSIKRVTLALLLAGCPQRQPVGVPAEAQSADDGRYQIPAAPLSEVPEAARTYYAQRCGLCHGTRGRGDGPSAVTLRPGPRDLSDRLWQSNVNNDHLRRIILGGGAAVGKSLAMPAHPELAQDPRLLEGLVTLVRTLARPPRPPAK